MLLDSLRRPATSRGLTTTTTKLASVDAVAELDDENFEPNTSGEWTMVDFYAPWCGPCRTFHPVFDDVAAWSPRCRRASRGSLSTRNTDGSSYSLGRNSGTEFAIHREGAARYERRSSDRSVMSRASGMAVLPSGDTKTNTLSIVLP